MVRSELTTGLSLSERAAPAIHHFTFKVTEAEYRIFRQLLTRNLKPLLSRRILKGIRILAFVVMITPAVAAMYFDRLPLSAVLLMELSFGTAYLAMNVANHLATRRLHRDLFRHTRSVRELFDCRFEDAGVTVGRGTLVTRMDWSSISSVEDIGIIVAFWYDPTQGFFLPYHVFEDDAARIAFSTWAKERIRQAASPSP